MSKNLIYPFYYRVIRRAGTDWFYQPGTPFFNGTNKPMDMENAETEYNTTKTQVIIELFRINGGKPGYYLANLRDRKYYYCGLTLENVRETLYSLGIGRKEPHA
ncbi:MAG: hypothetical protein HC820_05565 [Hydrococcus sp. RM1_1_31]|nr:hypothetical protein [Hydrococcus sp. RM1_1_31]